jgi:hypothetical protein
LACFFSAEPIPGVNPAGNVINLDPLFFPGVPNWATGQFAVTVAQIYACKKAATAVAG